MKELAIILGNGFTIDLINHLKYSTYIDVIDLFAKGSELKFPGRENSGFLTSRNCPSLIALGIYPGVSKDKANEVFEKIITCANFFHYGEHFISSKETSLYVKAYFEIVEYLKFLFIWYDELFSNMNWRSEIETWQWFKFLKESIDKYDKIHIYTLNYDTFLEKCLDEIKASYRIVEVEKSGDHKFEIYKPHGSISFTSTAKSKVETPYSIPLNFRDSIQSSDINVEYESLINNRIINTIIPPYGDKDRTNASWSAQMTSIFANNIKDCEKVLICGVSYWHVDRKELDSVLLAANKNSEILNINPNPSSLLNAILQSRFEKFEHHRTSSILRNFYG
ncbi:SIR2 family protein [Rheinheimera texasensis]|uniref:SIR2 family protein n=1 Tax=Rheinheimera texasensis TaxID=306205 RepID=UPI0032B23F64